MSGLRPARLRFAERPRRAFRATPRRPLMLAPGAMFDPGVIRLSTPDRRRPFLLMRDEADQMPGATLGRSSSACARGHPIAACRSRTMTGRRPPTIRGQTVAHSLAVLSLYARFSTRPFAYPQARRAKIDRVLGIQVFGLRASELIVDITRTRRVHPVPTSTSLIARSPWPAYYCAPLLLRTGPARHFRSEP